MSRSLSDFKESMQLAEALKKIERTYPQNPNLTQQPDVKGLRGGAAVLMVAAFEFFLKNLFIEYIGKLNTIPKTIDFEKLPKNLKVTSVYGGLNEAMSGPRFRTKPPKVDRIKTIVEACKQIIIEQIDPNTFSNTSSNPSGETVKGMFKNVGIDNIFGKIKTDFEAMWHSPVPNDFINSKLDEIVRTRHIVAHTSDTLNISRASQNEAIKFLGVLSELLANKLDEHVQSLQLTAAI